jgi:phosphoribosyl-ATP pyrophosphohydrolase
MTEFSLNDLAATIAERAKSLPETSYTASLLELGTAYCARKFGEESVEAVVAAVEGDSAALVSEAADVVYHLLVLLQSCGVGFEPVMAELGRRSGQSGLQEKAARGTE